MRDVPGRPTVAEVSLGALRANCREAQACVGPGVGVMAVVKADAYGHGAVAAARAFVEAGAAAVHFEDQLSSAKKCGHLGGKVVVPIREFIQKLVAARLAADVMGVPAILIARTDADSARLLQSDVDERDRPFLTGTRTEEGFFGFRGGIEAAIARGLAYAPYADMLWCETSHPDLDEAAAYMQRLFSDREYGKQIGAAAAAHMRRYHSHEAIGRRYAKRLQQIVAARNLLASPPE